MNWQSVKAAPGQFVKLQVVITEITYQSGQWGLYALGKAQDGPGQIEQVLFTVGKNTTFPTDLAVNHRINCAGRYDANTQKIKVFFDSYAQGQAPAPNSYPPPQHAAPQSHQPANTPPRDATGISIERQCAWKAACEVAARRSPMGLDETEQWALRGWQFMTDGRLHPQELGQNAAAQAPPTQPAGPNPDWVGENPPQVDDDSIPF